MQSLENRIANLERLLREVSSAPFIRFTPLTLQQYSSRDDVGDSPTTHGRTLTNPHPLGDQHNLGLLPASAYSKPEDMDPLSLLAEETGDSDDEFFSLPETIMETPRSFEVSTGEHTSRFYGKSSLLAFTSQAFDERAEGPPTNCSRMYRREFWDTPDVILLV